MITVDREFVREMMEERDRLRDCCEKLLAGIRKHRDQRGDDRCWQDDEELYKLLPEGYTPPARDTKVELENCQKFIANRHSPKTQYVSPEREIERLRNEVHKSSLQRMQAEMEKKEMSRLQELNKNLCFELDNAKASVERLRGESEARRQHLQQQADAYAWNLATFEQIRKILLEHPSERSLVERTHEVLRICHLAINHRVPAFVPAVAPAAVMSSANGKAPSPGAKAGSPSPA